jgi:hypothetical protein
MLTTNATQEELITRLEVTIEVERQSTANLEASWVVVEQELGNVSPAHV